ncbi:MAG: ABC transporter ATP-binding protein [Gammaproteobacteria bacterium]|nr:ABC transporter ATP-binding protein [Gammaproteobacteria bacterium]
MIQFNQVSKQFKNVQVLKNIQLDMNAGDRIALVGSNGAGKTTLIRCLLGQYNHQGSVRVHDLVPRENRELVLRHVGFVPQLPPPLKMPVEQLIDFSAKVSHADFDRIVHVAERLGLNTAELLKRPFVKLSGGQKQKLLISIALGRDTDILIMDEPAANLDPEARHIFFQLLSEKPKDTIMLISSHRLDEVAALVNRVIEMDCGEVILDDHVEDLVDMTSQLFCRIGVLKEEPAFVKAISEWGFTETVDAKIWEGVVAGPDRLRFLGMISRYAGLLSSITMNDGVK